jgi:hypothetical protein
MQPSQAEQSEQKPPARKRSRSEHRAVSRAYSTNAQVPSYRYGNAGSINGSAGPAEAIPIRQEALPSSHGQLQMDPALAPLLATSGEQALILARDRELSARLALLSDLSQPHPLACSQLLAHMPSLYPFLNHPAPPQQLLSRESQMLRVLDGSSLFTAPSHSSAILLQRLQSQQLQFRSLAQSQRQLEQNQILQALAGSSLLPGSHHRYLSAATSQLLPDQLSRRAHAPFPSTSIHQASLAVPTQHSASLRPSLLAQSPERINPTAASASPASRSRKPTLTPKPPPQTSRTDPAARLPPPPLGDVSCRYHPRAAAVSVPTDQDRVSRYQRLLREQMLFVEATGLDARATMQGRNKPIKMGQVSFIAVARSVCHYFVSRSVD